MNTVRDFQLTEQQSRELKLAFLECSDGPTRTRLQAVRLYGTGYVVTDIQDITACSRRSLLRWCQRYREQGFTGLMDQRLGGNRALLSDEQLQDVCDRLHQNRPVDVLGAAHVATSSGHYWTVPDLAAALQQWHGITYRSPGAYRKLLERCGFSYQRTAKVYRSRRAEQVAEFEEQLEKK